MQTTQEVIPDGLQGYDRYAYVNNNPLRYTDPTGHNWESCGDRSGYRCKIHMNHVQQAKVRWAAEAQAQQQAATQKASMLAAESASAYQAATQFAQQEIMNFSGSVIKNNDVGLSLNNFGDILDHTKDDDATLSLSQTTSLSGPNWAHIVEGVGIILAVDLLIVAPIVIGVILTSPEIEPLMVLDLPWEMAFVSTVVAVNAYGIKLIVNGAQGR